ncbi:5-formyltetrahydrofolate cyclo-ligase [Vararia minispora EC-137]|uniref:5-formyltetrahydrofolate cyclo-ligase n=1 Tax=Vararia minispora EC-137 TaxID=1314806 RepID=A0ACB8QJ08_9AGAM|nr:5-formyltetrahydrofolate cyclo-ligase [Vararia minispora EC-137]
MAGLQAQKRALRKAIASSLSSLRPAEIEADSRTITERVVGSSWFSHSRAVSCFLSMPNGEVDTSLLVSAILRAGKTLYVPRMHPERRAHMDFLQICDEADLSSLPSGLWGIREPGYTLGDAPRKNATDPDADPLDVIFLPGLAFDRTFARLGHGKGYYDRFLSAYGKPRPLLGLELRMVVVALAFRGQVLEAGEVPMAEHDWRVDLIISPDGILANPHGLIPSSSNS